MTRVLPEPAPARISSGPSVCSTASRCSGFSDERKESASDGSWMTDSESVSGVSAGRGGFEGLVSRELDTKGPCTCCRRDAGIDVRGEHETRIEDGISIAVADGPAAAFFLLHGDALGQVSRLIDVAAAAHGNVIRQQLQRNHRQRPARAADALRAESSSPGSGRAPPRADRRRGHQRDHRSAARLRFLDVARASSRTRRRSVAMATTGMFSSMSAIGPCFISPAG